MSSFWCIGLPIALIVTFVVVGLAGLSARPAPQPNDPVLHVVFSMERCGPCDDLKVLLKTHGVNFVTIETREEPAVQAFPAVAYIQGNKLIWDNGQRIKSGRYNVPEKPVEIVHWKSR